MERPRVRYLMGMYLGFDRIGHLPKFTTIEVVSEETAEIFKQLGFFSLADPVDEYHREVFDARVADERKWSRLTNRKRRT